MQSPCFLVLCYREKYSVNGNTINELPDMCLMYGRTNDRGRWAARLWHETFLTELFQTIEYLYQRPLMAALERLKDLSLLLSVKYLMLASVSCTMFRRIRPEHEINMERVKCFISDRPPSTALALIHHIWGFAWRIIVGSGFHDRNYWTPLLQSQTHTH